MFEQLVNEAAARFNVSTASVSALVRELLSIMADDRTGGAEGFVGFFRRAGLGDALTSWFGRHEGKPIHPTQLQSAIGANAIDKLALSSGLRRTAAASVAAFLVPRMMGLVTPNGVLSQSTLLSQAWNYVDRSADAAATPHIEAVATRPPRLGPMAWAAVAAVLLTLGLLLWLRAPAATIDPQLTLANQDGQITYSGVVHDDATRNAILSALRGTFGASNVRGDLRVDPDVRRIGWLPHFDDLVASLKRPGVEVAFAGDTVKLGGWLSVSERQVLTDELTGIFGPSAVETLADPAVEAVKTANDKALSALAAIGTSGVNPDALVQAMNLAVINFATGSAEITAESLEVVRKSAEAIKRAPAGATVEIAGHTDNTGTPASNLTLSLSRADAVKAVLISEGVPAGRLITRGYGDTRPRASNDTEFGRFQNRRIEYAVLRY